MRKCPIRFAIATYPPANRRASSSYYTPRTTHIRPCCKKSWGTTNRRARRRCRIGQVSTKHRGRGRHGGERGHFLVSIFGFCFYIGVTNKNWKRKMKIRSLFLTIYWSWVRLMIYYLIFHFSDKNEDGTWFSLFPTQHILQATIDICLTST